MIALVLSAIASIALTRLVLEILQRRAILDHPNERSSHTRPTPRGGGWGLVPVVLVAWLTLTAIGMPAPHGVIIIAAVAIALMSLSWLDDLRGLSPALRLAAQGVAVIVGLALLPPTALVLQGLLPLWADRVVTLLAWLWFVNLTNFMDGIDGISGSEIAAIGLGLAVAGNTAAGATLLSPFALTLTGAALGFLVWNWHPARLFLGDVGSVPLGFLTGWLLIQAAVAGLWLPALILPAYYLADATITLARRAWRGERIWQAHREHFYQKAVGAGRRHDQVVLLISAANLLLILCATTAVSLGAIMLVPAAVVVLILLVVLARPLDGPPAP
ncbi:MAG: glycosyltransferase family 4 protein [Azospirillaceae bacterium]|nr:glycosyltransferase family 4 protein [Azospirillaceae bacterium]